MYKYQTSMSEPLVPVFGSGGGPEPLLLPSPFSPPPPPSSGSGGLSREEEFPPPPVPPPPPKLFLSRNVSWSKLSKNPPLRIISSSSSAKASALAAARLTARRTSSVAATPAVTPAAIVSPPKIQVIFLCFLVAVPETTAVMDSAREPDDDDDHGDINVSGQVRKVRSFSPSLLSASRELALKTKKKPYNSPA